MSTSAVSSPPVPLESYRLHQEEISLLMSHFFVGYLRDIYTQFEGDLALVIVLGEIAHHNMSTHFAVDGPPDRAGIRRLELDEALRSRLPACNAYSLAAATGLPRETIRRKITRLETLGWVERAGRREVRITAAVARHFQPDFNFNLLSNLLTTAERIRAVLQSPPAPTPS
jgi:DNA-binding transcriptional ArsR family regulator